MPNYDEETKKIEVPKGTGVPGLLKAITAVLELPRVQNISIDSTGLVTYTRLRKAGEPESNVDQEFDSLMPWQVIRSHAIVEVQLPSINAAVVIGAMFSQANIEGYNPVAFVGNPSTRLWHWYTSTTKVVTNRDEFYGLPFLSDRQVPEEALLLCVAYGRRASMVDVVKSYKVSIPMPVVKRS